MQAIAQTSDKGCAQEKLQRLISFNRWETWKPHFSVPKNTEVVAETAREAFHWLSPRSVQMLRFEDSAQFAHLQYNGLGSCIRERYIQQVNPFLPDDAAHLRCTIMSLYKDAHAYSLWSLLHTAPSQITLICTLSETVRLLLFYGTCFNSLNRSDSSELSELERMLALYEVGFMPIGLSPQKTLYIVTG